MFVLVAVILGLIIGKARGGRLKNIRLKNINLWFLGLVGAILQIGLHLYFYIGAAPSALTVVNFVSYILVLLMFIFNFNDVWTILMTIGVTANFIVTFINGGKMPVSTNIINVFGNQAIATMIGDGSHALYTTLTTDSTLWVLGAVLPVPVPQLGQITAIYGGLPGLSVGSILALFGCIGYVQYAMNQGISKEDADFLDDSDVGRDDYIIAPDELEKFVPQEENRYKTGPLDWLSDTSGEIFTMTDKKTPAASEKSAKQPEKKSKVDDESAQDEQDKTMVLPDLSPELLDQIRNHGKTRNIDFGKREKREDLENTRVFTTLKDLGRYDTKPLPTVKNDPVAAALTEEESFASDGFFTQTYYKGQEKTTPPEDNPENTADEAPQTQAFSADEPAAQDTDRGQAHASEPAVTTAPLYTKTRDNTEEESMPEQKSQNKTKQPKQTVVPERTSASPWASVKKPKAEKRKNREAAQKINPYRKYSAEQAAGQIDISKEDEKRMLDVWHQVSEETKALRSRAKRQTATAVDQADPFEASERSRQELKQEHTRAARLNHYPEEEAAGRVANHNQKQASTKAASGESTKPTTDEEREKAGFKKVELNVDGKSFSYWRKKKSDD